MAYFYRSENDMNILISDQNTLHLGSAQGEGSVGERFIPSFSMVWGRNMFL